MPQHEAAELLPACHCSKGDVCSHLPAPSSSPREALLFGLFSFTGLGEGSSISFLAAGQGWGFSGCLEHQLLSASSDLLEKKISAALPSPDDVVLSKPPLFASRVALEKAEPVSLASLGCRWSWWISGPGFFFVAGGVCSPKAGKRLLCHPSPWQWVFCCVYPT